MEDVFGNELCEKCCRLKYSNLDYMMASHPRADWLTPEDFKGEILAALKRGCIHTVKRLAVRDHEYIYEAWSPKAYAIKFYREAIKANSLEALQHFHNIYNLPVFFIVGHFALEKKYGEFNRKAPLYLAIEMGRVEVIEWIFETFHPDPEYLKIAFAKAVETKNLCIIKFLHKWIEDESINSEDEAFIFTQWYVFWQYVYRHAIDLCFKNGEDEKYLEIFKYIDDVVSIEGRELHCVCEYAQTIIWRDFTTKSKVNATKNLIANFWLDETLEEDKGCKMKNALIKKREFDAKRRSEISGR